MGDIAIGLLVVVVVAYLLWQLVTGELADDWQDDDVNYSFHEGWK